MYLSVCGLLLSSPPLSQHLVAKYAGQLSQQDLATGEAHLRSSLAVATRRRSLLCPQPPTSASASDTASSTRYNNNNNNNNNSSSSSSSSGSGGGGVFRRHVPASPSKHLHSQKECSPYSSSAATAVATASELTVLSQVSADESHLLQCVCIMPVIYLDMLSAAQHRQATPLM